MSELPELPDGDVPGLPEGFGDAPDEQLTPPAHQALADISFITAALGLCMLNGSLKLDAEGTEELTGAVKRLADHVGIDAEPPSRITKGKPGKIIRFGAN